MRFSLNRIRVVPEPRDWLICSKPECLFKVFTQADKEKSSVRVNEASSSHHKRTQPATVCKWACRCSKEFASQCE